MHIISRPYCFTKPLTSTNIYEYTLTITVTMKYNQDMLQKLQWLLLKKMFIHFQITLPSPFRYPYTYNFNPLKLGHRPPYLKLHCIVIKTSRYTSERGVFFCDRQKHRNATMNIHFEIFIYIKSKLYFGCLLKWESPI